MASAGMPDFVYARAKHMVRTGAHYQFNAMPVPDLGIEQALSLFYDHSDFATMNRMATLAPRKRRQETLRIVMPVGDEIDTRLDIHVTFTSELPYMLPDELTREIDWSSPAVEKLRAWAEWRYDTARDWAQVWAMVEWFRSRATTLNQLKHVWPDFMELLQGVDKRTWDTSPHEIKVWGTRFKQNSGWSRQPPGLPHAYLETLRDARNTVQKIKLLTTPEDQSQGLVRLTISENTSTHQLRLPHHDHKFRGPYAL